MSTAVSKQAELECVSEVIKLATENKNPFEAVMVGNIIKTLWSYERKPNPIEELAKVEWYARRLLKEVTDKLLAYKPVATEKGISLETPWGSLMTPKQGDMFQPKQEVRAQLLKVLLKNKGFCPCQPTQTTDTMCPCKTYREEGKCICGLFVKIPQEVTQTEPEEVANNETEIKRVDTTTEDSKE